MPPNRKRTKKPKSTMMGFRVDDDVRSKIETHAAMAGKTPTDWCRDVVLARVGEGISLTANEELLLSEIIRFGNVMATFLHHVVTTGKMTSTVAQQLLDALNEERREIAKRYLAELAEANTLAHSPATLALESELTKRK